MVPLFEFVGHPPFQVEGNVFVGGEDNCFWQVAPDQIAKFAAVELPSKLEVARGDERGQILDAETSQVIPMLGGWAVRSITPLSAW